MGKKSIGVGIVLVISVLAIGLNPVHATPPPDPPLPGQTITIQSTPLQVSDGSGKRRVSAPQVFLQSGLATASAPGDIVITFDGDFPEEAKNAFNYAASIWSALIDPAVPITILARSDDSCFMCGASSVVYIDLMPLDDILYPRTLLNHLTGEDMMPDDPDFEIYYASSAYEWYFGTDGNPAFNQVDLVTVILHEIGHGLGLIDTFFMDSETGHWGSLNLLPFKYDTFLVNGAGQSLIDTSLFPNYSPELKSQLHIDDLYFDGPMTRAANQGQRAKVESFPPYNFSPSTLCHLHEADYEDTANALMTTTLYPGEAIHNPGPITLGILADLGWMLSPNLPVFYPLPSQMIQANTQRSNAIDLWSYIPAEQSPGTNFTYEISNTPSPEAGVSLRDNRYIDLAPQTDWTGNTEVTIQATNLLELSASQTFDVLVVAELHNIFLPAIAR